MFTRYNLVQFDDNTYGVLKTTCGLFKSFVDIRQPDLCWRMQNIQQAKSLRNSQTKENKQA